MMFLLSSEQSALVFNVYTLFACTFFPQQRIKQRYSCMRAYMYMPRKAARMYFGLADILQEAYGAPPYRKWLKSFWPDHKKTFSGWGKFGKNDVKFQKHGV